MRFIKILSLILFIIALLAFGAFMGYHFSVHHQKTAAPQTLAEHVDKIVDEATDDFQGLFSSSSSLHQKDKKDIKAEIKKKKSDIISENPIKNKRLDTNSKGNEESSSDDIDMLDDDVPDLQNLVGSDFSDNEDEKHSNIQKDDNNDMLSNDKTYEDDRSGLDFSNDNNADKVKKEKSEQTALEQDNPTHLSLPIIKETNIDNISNIPPLEDDSDNPFDSNDEMSDKELYNILTSGEDTKNKQDEDIEDGSVQNIPETGKTEDNPDIIWQKDDNISTFEDDIFSNSDILETNIKDEVNPNDIFNAPSLRSNDIKNPTPKEDLNSDDILGGSPLKSSETEKSTPSDMPSEKKEIDPNILKQIDLPDDIFMPDERQIGQTPLMIEPTDKISEETKEDIMGDLFPSKTETMQSEIIETNKALAAKNDPNIMNDDGDEADIFAGDDILSNVTGSKTGSEEDMSDIDLSTDQNNSDIESGDSQTVPLTTDIDPNLIKPSGLQDSKNLSPEEKIAITPFTSMQASSATCRFEHVIDAKKMSEQFRLTVLPPNGDVPLKMEMIQDLSLDKFLTMKMDEIDGYPDSFSSLEVFCKEMTVSKRLIENY